MSMLLNFMFPTPSSIFITTMSIMNFVVGPYYGISEIRGKHMNYSKFRNANNDKNNTNSRKQIKLSGKIGMLLFYTPSFLAAVASFWIFPNEGLRSRVLQGALTFHYFKRVFEALFIHKYSGPMLLDSATPIILGYFTSTITLIYAQHLTNDVQEPSINLLYPGIVLFLVGIIGNFYHHFLLSKLRVKGEKEYKIPKGGLFGIVICPHYLFEMIDFYGVFFISQTLYSLSIAISSTLYLLGRSYATRNWYLSKFEDFPKNVKVVIPFVF